MLAFTLEKFQRSLKIRTLSKLFNNTNMKSPKLFLLLLSVAVLFASCKKENNSKKACHIITATINGITSVNISYNADGKVATITNGKDVKTFQYSGNTVIINETYSGSFSGKTIIDLSAQGLALSAKMELDAAGTKWNNYQYEYSGQELIKQTYTTQAGGVPNVITVKWTNGNPTSVVGSGVTTTYDYYNDKPANPGDYWSLSQLVQGYKVIAPKNALKSTASLSSIYSFSYSSDADGNFTGVVIDDGTPPPDSWTYQYQCN
jgi:hypothetical protein